MNPYDLIILVLLTYSAVMGFKRGFTRVILELLAFIVSIACSFTYYKVLSHTLIQWLPTLGSIASIASFMLIWALTLGCLLTIASAVSRWMTGSFLGIFDRILGLALGFIRGLVVLVPLMALLIWLHIPIPHQSKLLSFLVELTKKWLSH